MRKTALAVLLALACVAVPFITSNAEPAASYIVVLNESVRDPAAVAREHARSHAAVVDLVYSSALNGYAARMSPQAAARITEDDRVAWVEPDRPVYTTAQTLPTGINRIDAELSASARIDGIDDRVNVDVAVLDTGIDPNHRDLNVVGGRNCSTGKNYKDGHGHGTHVAGTIAAKDNSEGVVGVAPGARLWSVRVLGNSGSGSISTVVCGIDWVAANSATIEVANMSLGGSGSDDGNCGNTNRDAEHRAICNATGRGVTFVVSAGNSSIDAKNQIPASYDEVITVSALADFDGVAGGVGSATCRSDSDDTFANFSNFGGDIDVIAPGVCIYSTAKGGSYTTMSGTSMASPHVAGAAALYKAANPGATPATVKSALQTNGTFDWNNSDDHDSLKEPLLKASAL